MPLKHSIILYGGIFRTTNNANHPHLITTERCEKKRFLIRKNWYYFMYKKQTHKWSTLFRHFIHKNLQNILTDFQRNQEKCKTQFYTPISYISQITQKLCLRHRLKSESLLKTTHTPSIQSIITLSFIANLQSKNAFVRRSDRRKLKLTPAILHRLYKSNFINIEQHLCTKTSSVRQTNIVDPLLGKIFGLDWEPSFEVSGKKIKLRDRVTENI